MFWVTTYAEVVLARLLEDAGSPAHADLESCHLVVSIFGGWDAYGQPRLGGVRPSQGGEDGERRGWLATSRQDRGNERPELLQLLVGKDEETCLLGLLLGVVSCRCVLGGDWRSLGAHVFWTETEEVLERVRLTVDQELLVCEVSASSSGLDGHLVWVLDLLATGLCCKALQEEAQAFTISNAVVQVDPEDQATFNDRESDLGNWQGLGV